MPAVIVHMSEEGIEPAAGEPFVRVYGPFEDKVTDVYEIAQHLEDTRGGRVTVRSLREPSVLETPEDLT